MLFHKNSERLCALCERASVIDENDMLCRKRGVVSRNYHCRKFQYDPLKRIPQKANIPSSDRYDTKDFSLVTDENDGKTAN